MTGRIVATLAYFVLWALCFWRASSCDPHAQGLERMQALIAEAYRERYEDDLRTKKSEARVKELEAELDEARGLVRKLLLDKKPGTYSEVFDAAERWREPDPENPTPSGED